MPKGTTRNLAGNHGDPVYWFSAHHTTFFNLLTEVSGTENEPASRKRGCWWEWTGRYPPQFLHGPVLLFGCGAGESRPGWTIAPRGAYPGPGVVALPARDLSLLGILNSLVFWLYLFSSGTGQGTGGMRDQAISEFPLYLPDPECSADTDLNAAIALLVKRRLSLGSGLLNALPGSDYDQLRREVAVCEDEIDRCVSMVYGMSATDRAEAGYIVSGYMQRLAGSRIRRR